MGMDDDVTQVGEGGEERGSVLKPGEVFEAYKVVRLLGRGGMGEVYEVEHRDLGTRHALKLIHPDIVGRAGSAERFAREAKVMAQLRHDNIVHVDDFRQSGERAWLRMELVGGEIVVGDQKTEKGGCEFGSGSLADLVKRQSGRLPEAQVREVLCQVLEGLSYAHGKGVVHRDLKPANLLLEGDSHGGTEVAEEEFGKGFRVKIVDFGLVRLAGEQWVQSQVQQSVTRSMTMGSAPTEVDSEASGGTSTKALLGTFAYMSPEQKRGEEADARSDLYAVGLMAYQMLTGQESIGMERPSELVAGLDPAWDRWVMQATAGDRERRYADAGEMLEALPAESTDRRASGGPVAPEKSPGRGGVRSGRGIWVLGAVAFLVLGVAGGLWYWDTTTGGLAGDGETEIAESGEEAKAAVKWGSLVVQAVPEATIVAIGEGGGRRKLGSADGDGLLEVHEGLPVGLWDLEGSAEGFGDGRAESIRIAGTGTAVARLEMEPLPGSLILATEPPGAELEVNGEVVGASPQVVPDLPPLEAISVVARMEGYREYRDTVELDPGGTERVVAQLLEPTGLVEVRLPGSQVDPRALEVRIDGESVSAQRQEGQLLFEGLAPGSRVVSIRHPDYEAWERTVAIRDAETTDVEVELEPKPGILEVSVSPSTAQWSLWVDGKSLGQQRSYELSAERSHRLAVKAQGFQTAQRRIQLPANGRERWSVNLEKWKSIEAGEDWEVELPEGEGVELVWIEPGEFLMGSPSNESGRDDAERQHGVVLTRGYWLGKYEVTLGEWEALMGNNPSLFDGVGARAPVERVSWNDAMDFCWKLTQRERAAGRLPEGLAYSLPTEAQWEYACRAGTQTRFSFGNSESDLQNYGNYADKNTSFDWSDKTADDGYGYTAPVGSFKPNAWGLYDMHGNVWEWCLDWKGDYPSGTVRDPTGPSSGSFRVYRGGGWYSFARYCRSAYRSWDTPGFTGNFLGFRLALSSVR